MAKNKVDPETGLSPRQRNLLFAVIKEYCEFGSTVSSKDLRDKYGFDVSPATIRNEFASLRDLGYLYQPFTNSSSQPTEKSFKLFINQLIVGLQVTTRQQQELKRQILELEDKHNNLQREIGRLLALQTGTIAFSVNPEQENITGIKNLLSGPLEHPVSDLLDFLDNLDHHKQYLLEHKAEIEEVLIDKSKKQKKPKNLTTIFGSDNPVIPLGKGYALAATKVMIEGQPNVVGLIMPTRLLARKQNLELIDSLSKILNPPELGEEQ